MKAVFKRLVFGLVIVACSVSGATAETPPNILFILVDDLAWSDLGCYGHRWHQTPNIDRLAAGGVRLINGYAPAPICSASRASLLTGKTTARLGFEFVVKDRPGFQKIEGRTALRAPPFTLDLPLQEKTIAETLSDAGYETAFFGKWHLNRHHGRYLGWSPTHGPAAQGFQVAVEDFGAHPYAWKRSPPELIETQSEYAVDSMVENVCRYLAEPNDKPFFVMASSFYVHTPVKTPCRWLVDSYDRVVPHGIKNRQKRVEYAAFLQTLDHHVGRMLEAVEESGRAERTLIFFMSDNGGHPEYTGNAPLRGSKWNLYEGGIRVPMIAKWPDRISAGTTSDVPVIGYDLLPTFAEAASAASPDVDGVSILDVLTNASTASTGASPSDVSRARDLLWHFPYYHPERGYRDAKETIGVDDFRVSKTRPQSALRRGKYKLLWFAEDDRVELYDLDSDPSERQDLSMSHEQQAKELRVALHRALIHSKARMAEKNRRAETPAE